MSTTTLRHVAERAGVSVGTVSNVLNRPTSVRPETRERVERAIADLGFVRNEAARHLRAGTSRLLAYVFPDAANPFFTDVARAAQHEARRHGLMLVLCDSDSDAELEDAYLELLLEQRVRGVLITPVDGANPRLHALPGRGIPIALVDRVVGADVDAASVGVDDVEGGRLAVTHLLESGHERVAFVGSLTMPQVGDRLAGARAALAAAGRDPDRLTLVQASHLTAEQGRRAGERLLGIPAGDRPTAAFCANDLLALGLLQEMTRQGVRVPEDLAIVGYDDVDFAAAAAVPLTSVRQPRDDLGRLAVGLLIAEPDGDAPPERRHPVLRPELVVRASSRRA